MAEPMQEIYEKMNSEKALIISMLQTKASIWEQIATFLENSLAHDAEKGWHVVHPDLIDEAFRFEERANKNGFF